MQEAIIGIEKIVISSILFSPEKFEEIAAELRANDFLYPMHRDIFDMCEYLQKQNLPIDSELILSKKPANKNITQEILLDIAATNPIANIEAYVEEIKAASMKRELHSLANLLREKSLDNDNGVDEIIDTIEKRLSDIALGKGQDNVYDAKSIAQDTIKHIIELKKRGNRVVVGLDTGFKRLNMLTTGFNKGDLIIIGARPSMGKTTFALNLAQNMLDNSKKGVVIFSLEMPYIQLGMRMLSAKSSINLQNLRNGNLNDNEIELLSAMMDKMANQPLHIVDASSLNIAQLKGRLRRLKKQHDIGVAIIDYLQLMNSGKSESKQIEISEISRGLKMLARELEIPIIALSQLNRFVESREDKRPILSDLRDSGAIEQDADVILFLYRDDVYARRADKERYARLKREGKEKDFKPEHIERNIEPAEIIIAKNRNGEIGNVEIVFNKQFTRFEDKPESYSAEMTETRIDGAEFMQQMESANFSNEEVNENNKVDVPNIF